MINKFPKFMSNHHLWIAILAIVYIVSGISGNTETVWQVVVVISTYIGGTAMKEFATDVLSTLRKIDLLLEAAGIEWEEVLKDAIVAIKEAKSD